MVLTLLLKMRMTIISLFIMDGLSFMVKSRNFREIYTVYTRLDVGAE